MFQQLATLLKAKGDVISFTTARENETQLRVTLIPKLSGGEKLNRPLSLTGTPEELDSPEFAQSLTTYTESVKDLRSALDEAAAEAKATATATRTATATKKAGGPTKKPAAKPAPKTPAKPSKKNPLLKRKGAPVAAAPAPQSEPGDEATAPAPEPRNAAEATQSLI